MQYQPGRDLCKAIKASGRPQLAYVLSYSQALACTKLARLLFMQMQLAKLHYIYVECGSHMARGISTYVAPLESTHPS